MAQRLALLPLLQVYVDRDPATAAHLLETVEEAQAIAVLKALSPQLCAKVFPYLQATYAATLLKDVPPALFQEIVKRMRPEQAATVLVKLPAEFRKTLLESLPDTIKRQIPELLIYPENSVGRIMTTDFLALHETIKVRDAIQKIRAVTSRQSPSSYAYVVDGENRLVGVLNMRDLLLSSSDETLQSIMKREVFSLNGFMDREEAANEIAKKHFFAAPIVDAENQLLGIVTTSQLIGDVQEEATEDILKMVGAGGDERTFSPITYSLKKRVTWLHINLATAFLAAWVVSLFEDVIAKITILAVFLPVVAGQGGNAGAQSLAVVMRGLVLREIRPSNAWKLIYKEVVVGVLNGIIIGVVTAAIAWLWHGNPYLGVVIGLAMLVNLTAAGLAGATIPLIMKAFGFDPAQSSSIILTTVTDVVGFFAFLGFAVLFQSRLM